MALTQAKADQLPSMAKEFVEGNPLLYPHTQPLKYDRALRSVERGNRNRTRLKYQTRARAVIMLARIGFNGAPTATRPIRLTAPTFAWNALTSTAFYMNRAECEKFSGQRIGTKLPDCYSVP